MLYIMIQRRIFSALEAHLFKKPVTVITGMRRVGKTSALKYLLEKVPHRNKIYIDLEKADHRFIFQRPLYRDVQIDLEIEGINFDQPAVIALDEIQLVPEITSIVKYFHDTFPTLKFIISGSSSFYLKNRFSESLAGRKQIFEMYPLDFLEFLWFRGVEDTTVLERFSRQPYQQSIYFKYKEHYEDYLRFGGFPDVALADSAQDKTAFLKDIVNAYIDLDIRLLSDLEASNALIRLIRLLASRAGHLLEISNITGILGMDKRKVTAYLDLLEKTYFIHFVAPFTRNVGRELSYRKKVYLADTGILQQLAQVGSGQVFENAIYLQCMKLANVNYYQKRSGQEVDFVVDEKIAIEVKETPHSGDLAILKSRAAALNLNETQLVGRFPPNDGFQHFTWGGCIF